ncbi:hypothetical protein B0H19DRAFT_1158199 [Mycena capillaripes]|nr:hypothetical protein B0H19DRAFT_1158199 [Mycena capillaripes]
MFRGFAHGAVAAACPPTRCAIIQTPCWHCSCTAPSPMTQTYLQLCFPVRISCRKTPRPSSTPFSLLCKTWFVTQTSATNFGATSM